MPTLADLAAAQKTLSGTLDWTKPETETGYIWLNAAMDIDGVTVAGLVLHLGCYFDRPDCSVTSEIRLARLPARRSIPLMRVDWRSLQDGHSNRRQRGHALSGKRVSNSHIHAFEYNWMTAQGKMQSGNLPFADELERNLTTFREVCAYIGERFRITNTDVIPTPPWEQSLFSRLDDGTR